MIYFISGFIIGLILAVIAMTYILKESMLKLLQESICKGTIKVKGVYYNISKKDIWNERVNESI